MKQPRPDQGDAELTLHIRKARGTDIATLIDHRALLLDNSTASYGAGDAQTQRRWREAYEGWLKDHLHEPETIAVFIGENGWERHPVGTVTGVIDTRPPTPDCLTGRCGWVQSLVVQPSARRQGVSTALMDTLMTWFAAQRVDKVMLQSTPAAEKLYENLGFSQSGEKSYIKAGR